MRRVVVMVLLALLTAGCFGSSSPSVPSSTSTRRAGWHLDPVRVTGVRVRSIAAAFPYSLAAGQGQIWVAVHSGVGRIDAAAGRVRLVARIPNSGEWYDLAYDSGSVWYMTPAGVDGFLYRVDAASGHVEGRQRFDGGRLRRRSQAWHEVAAVRGGICVGRLASGSREAVLCSASDLRDGWWVRGGPIPLTAGGAGTVWIGGASLLEANPHTRHFWRLRLVESRSVV
jgi:hypothetical protein